MSSHYNVLAVRARTFIQGKHDFVSSPVFTKTKDGHRVCILRSAVISLLTRLLIQFPPNEYTENYSAVNVDSTSLINLLAGIPVGSLQLVCLFS